jgi:hypothetical protein
LDKEWSATKESEKEMQMKKGVAMELMKILGLDFGGECGE